MNDRERGVTGAILVWGTMILLGMLLFVNLSCKGLKIQETKTVEIERNE